MFLVLELIQGGQVMNWDDKAFRYCAPNTPDGVLQKEDARHCMRDVVMALSYRTSSLNEQLFEWLRSLSSQLAD